MNKVFNAEEFYARHDNAATEAFLREALSNVEFSMILSGECGCCNVGNDGCCDSSGEVKPEEVQWLHDRSEGMISILNEMGTFYRGTHQWDECLEAFSRSLGEMESLGLTQTNNYAVALLNTAGAYRLVGRLDEALDAYAQAEEIFTRNKCEDYYALASLFNNTGLVYQDKGDFKTAAEYYTKALEYTRKDTDNEAEIATGLANLAALYTASGDFAKAEQNVDESLAIFKDLQGGMNAHYAGALNTKAILAYRAGKLDESVEYFKQAIDKTKIIFGENGDYVKGCRNCAAVLTKLGRADEAAEYAAKADRAEGK